MWRGVTLLSWVEAIMGNLFALIVLGCFCVLSSYSVGKYGYEHKEPIKLVMAWKTQKAALLASVWNLSPEDVDKPVRLFTH